MMQFKNSKKAVACVSNRCLGWNLAGLVVVVLLLGLVPSAHGGWYSDSCWQYRKKLTLDSGLVEADQTDFPVLISFTNDSDLAAGAQSDFDDVLFTSSNGTTKLSHEIEDYDSTNGDIVAWVKIPVLSSSTDTDIYMYYGCGTAGDQQNVSDVWSNGYNAVYHLHETPADDAADGHKNSVSNSLHLTPDNINAGSSGGTTDATGRAAGADDFKESGDNLQAGDHADFTPSGDMTFQAWIKLDTLDEGVIVYKNDGEGPWWYSYRLDIILDSGYYRPKFAVNSAGDTPDCRKLI